MTRLLSLQRFQKRTFLILFSVLIIVSLSSLCCWSSESSAVSPLAQIASTQPSQAFPPLERPNIPPQRLDAFERLWLTGVFPQDSIPVRLARLEVLLFGEPKKEASLQERFDALNQIYTQTYRPPTQPQQQTQPSQQTVQSPTQQAVPSNQSTVVQDYPSVDLLELQVFGQANQKEPLEARLSRLEQKVYGTTIAAPLVERVDGLRAKILGRGKAKPAKASSQTGTPSSSFVLRSAKRIEPEDERLALAAERANTINPAVAVGLTQRLDALEQEAFKQSFPQLPEPQRLERLELAFFQQAAPPQATPEQRLQRLEAVASTTQQGSINDTRKSSFFRTALPVALTILLILL